MTKKQRLEGEWRLVQGEYTGPMTTIIFEFDKDGDLGIREHFHSPYRPGEKINIDLTFPPGYLEKFK